MQAARLEVDSIIAIWQFSIFSIFELFNFPYFPYFQFFNYCNFAIISATASLLLTINHGTIVAIFKSLAMRSVPPPLMLRTV